MSTPLLLSLGALTLANVLSQFFRFALGLVAPEVAFDLGLEPARLGVLSAAWFLAFAGAQIPVGMALDRLGPRRTVPALLLVAALGCAIFASSRSLGSAVLGQVLIGVGCAPVYMGALLVSARFLPPRGFGAASAVLLAIANGGTLLGGTPLALLVEALGWRGAFLGFGGAVLLAAALVLVLVRDSPPGMAPPAGRQDFIAVLRGVGAVAGNRTLWPVLAMLFMGYGVVVAIRGLWAGPYLAEGLGLAPVPRGHVLLLVSAVMIAAMLAYAWIERRLDERRFPVLVGAAITTLALMVLSAMPGTSLLASTILLCIICGCGMTYPLLIAQGRRSLPDALVGRGLTFLNGASFLGAAVIQVLAGLIVQLAPDQPEDMRWRMLFLFLAGCLLASLVFYRRSKDEPVRSNS